MKPTLHPTARYDIQIAVAHTIEYIEPIYQSCLNCLNFNENEEICNLCNQRPPAKVIAYGCPQWADIKEIPF
jgi:hypothetical protein